MYKNFILHLLVTVLICVGLSSCGKPEKEPVKITFPTEDNETPLTGPEPLPAPMSFWGLTAEEAVSSFEAAADEYDFEVLDSAFERIKNGEAYAYVPNNGAKILKLKLNILPKTVFEFYHASPSDLSNFTELAVSCKYLYGGRAYSVIWVSNPDDFDINLVSYSGDDKYTAEYGGYDVTFYGYSDYNTASGKDIDYISAFSVNIGGETVYFIPDDEFGTPARNGQKMMLTDIEATNEFFASLDEDFFKLDKLNLADFVSEE